MNISLFFVATEKTGGLFDLDGTLPLMGFQFLGLMFLLNFILYTPLLNLIYDRNQYINKNLASAANILAQSKKLIKNYENEINLTRKKGQQEISDLKTAYAEVLGLETKSASYHLTQISLQKSKNFSQKLDKALANLEPKLNYLCFNIMVNLFLIHAEE